jgi:hypothetical protein
MDLLEYLPSYTISIHRLLSQPKRTEQEQNILLDLIERDRMGKLLREQKGSEDRVTLV